MTQNREPITIDTESHIIPPAAMAVAQLVFVTGMRWRIEHDYQGLKQEFGLGHQERRG